MYSNVDGWLVQWLAVHAVIALLWLLVFFGDYIMAWIVMNTNHVVLLLATSHVNVCTVFMCILLTVGCRALIVFLVPLLARGCTKSINNHKNYDDDDDDEAETKSYSQFPLEDCSQESFSASPSTILVV
jgi:hypothetical protein